MFNTYKDVLFLNFLKLPPLGRGLGGGLLLFDYHLLGELVEGDFVGGVAQSLGDAS